MRKFALLAIPLFLFLSLWASKTQAVEEVLCAPFDETGSQIFRVASHETTITLGTNQLMRAKFYFLGST
jgi:hypothetical protein